MWGSVALHRDGVGYFSDPLGKPSLLTYWQTLLESTCGAVLLLSKRPADLALAAVEDSGDGVTVGLESCRRDIHTNSEVWHAPTSRPGDWLIMSLSEKLACVTSCTKPDRSSSRGQPLPSNIDIPDIDLSVVHIAIDIHATSFHGTIGGLSLAGVMVPSLTVVSERRQRRISPAYICISVRLSLEEFCQAFRLPTRDDAACLLFSDSGFLGAFLSRFVHSFTCGVARALGICSYLLCVRPRIRTGLPKTKNLR